MSRLFRVVAAISWGLGVLSLVGGFVLKLAAHWAENWNVTPRGALIFAAVLFLCALATRALAQQWSSQ